MPWWEPKSSIYAAIRGWLTLIISVILVFHGFRTSMPSQVMLGFSWLGTEPLVRAKNEVTPP